jgi:diguanylate cyclase (GGDEF)-like protein
MSSSALIYRQVLLKFTVPVAILLAVVLAVSLIAVFAIAEQETRVTREHEARLAESAVAVRRRQMESTVLDYGAWDDAVDRLATRLDPAWADANIGAWTFQSLGFDMAFVIAPDGSTRYASIDGKRSDRPVNAALTAGFGALVASQRAGERDSAASGLVLADGLPAIVAVAPIRYFTPGRESPGPPLLLVVVDRLLPGKLDQIEKAYLLPGMHAVSVGQFAEAEVKLVTAGGVAIGGLSWDGEQPGKALLRTVLPIWLALTGLFVLLAVMMLKQAQSAATMIAESEWRANHDALTRLPNRVLFFNYLDAASRLVADGGPRFALLYLDLDGFKLINDVHGHPAGDTVLKVIAERMSGEVGPSDMVARLGGDEFALVLDGHEQPAAIQAIGQRMIRALHNPIRLESGQDVTVGATIGVAIAEDDSTDPLVLLRQADEALFLGKRAGKGQVRFHAALAMQQAV